MRALLVALFEWVKNGITPPDSRFPLRADGTLVPLAEARARFPELPQANFPNVLNELQLRDHSVEPPIESTAYRPMPTGMLSAASATHWSWRLWLRIPAGRCAPLVLEFVADLSSPPISTPGQHATLIDDETWTAVRDQLAANAVERRRVAIEFSQRYTKRLGVSWTPKMRQ